MKDVVVKDDSAMDGNKNDKDEETP